MGTWLPCREKEVYSESLFLISCFHGDPLGRHFVFLAFQAKGEQEFINHLQDSDTKAFLISRTNFWWWTSYPASCRNSVSIFTSEISSVLMFVSPEPALCQKHETTMKVCRRFTYVIYKWNITTPNFFPDLKTEENDFVQEQWLSMYVPWKS